MHIWPYLCITLFGTSTPRIQNVQAFLQAPSSLWNASDHLDLKCTAFYLILQLQACSTLVLIYFPSQFDSQERLYPKQIELEAVNVTLVRDGRPALRGGGGSLPRPALWGGGGFPAPTRPVKMIKTAGKLRGKINTRISTFSKRGNKWWNNITTLNNAQSSLSIGYARESKKWKYFVLFLLTGHQTLFSKICQRMK